MTGAGTAGAGVAGCVAGAAVTAQAHNRNRLIAKITNFFFILRKNTLHFIPKAKQKVASSNPFCLRLNLTLGYYQNFVQL